MNRRAPFVPIAAALAAGIWLNAQFPLPPWLSLAAAAIAAAVAVAARQAYVAPNAAWAAALVALVAIGAAREAAGAPIAGPDSVARFAGRHVVIDGAIVDAPDARPGFIQVRVQPRRLAVSGAPIGAPIGVAGLVLVRADGTLPLRYGQIIRVDGRLEAPPRLSAFDYREYLARRGVFAWMPRPDRVWVIGDGAGSPAHAALLEARDAVRRSVQRILPAPESALLNGILIGDDNEIPLALEEAFRRTGTSHIVAISGFNVSIVIALVVPALSRMLNPRRAALFALPAIALYTLFVGASASVVRAAWMAALGLAGQLAWRKGFTLNTLCAAALIMLAIDANTLFDAGFQLSFLATLGLVLYASGLSRRAIGVTERVGNPRLRRWATLGLEGTLVTSAAQITTLPLIVATYGQLSLIALVVNAVVLPLQPPVMVLGALAAGLGIITPAAGLAAALPVYAFLTATIRAVEWAGALSFASVAMYGFGPPAAIAYYAALLGATALLSQPAEIRQALFGALRSRAATTAATVLIFTALVVGLAYWFQRPDGRLHVTFSGNGAFIVTPRGQHIAFSGAGILSALGRAMPAWDREVEWLIVPRRDDVALRDALPIAQRYRIAAAVLPPAGVEESSAMRAGWAEAARANVARALDAHPGWRVELEPGVWLEATGQAPQRGGQVIGLRVTFGRTAFELIGDARPATDQLRADVVFIGPRLADARAIAASAPRWVVWADSGAGSSGPAVPGVRAVALREVGEITFMSDGMSVVVK